MGSASKPVPIPGLIYCKLVYFGRINDVIGMTAARGDPAEGRRGRESDVGAETRRDTRRGGGGSSPLPSLLVSLINLTGLHNAVYTHRHTACGCNGSFAFVRVLFLEKIDFFLQFPPWAAFVHLTSARLYISDTQLKRCLTTQWLEDSCNQTSFLTYFWVLVVILLSFCPNLCEEIMRTHENRGSPPTRPVWFTKPSCVRTMGTLPRSFFYSKLECLSAEKTRLALPLKTRHLWDFSSKQKGVLSLFIPHDTWLPLRGKVNAQFFLLW